MLCSNLMKAYRTSPLSSATEESPACFARSRHEPQRPSGEAPEPSHIFEEHTGDVRIRVDAPTLPELFAEAGRALAELVGPEEGPKGPVQEEETAVVRASDRDALLVEWLNELIFRSETAKRIYTELAIESFSERDLRAKIGGFDAEDLRTPVKSATFHGLRIAEKPGGGYTASVVLDV